MANNLRALMMRFGLFSPSFNSILTAKAVAAWSTGRRIGAYAGTIADISGGNFTTVYDQIGARNATGTAAVGTGTIGGLNYPKLNGTTDQLAFTDLALGTGSFEVWAAVGVPTSMTSVGSYFGSASSSCSITGDGSAQITIRSISNSVAYNIVYATVPGVNIIRFVVDASLARLFLDINGERTDPTGRAIPGGGFTFNRIGRRGTAAVFSQSGPCEIIVFNQVLTSQEAEVVRINMNSAWRKGMFVDSVAGSDVALGWNDETAFQTVAAIITKVQRRGSVTNFKCGSTFTQTLKYNTTNQGGIAADPVIAQAYGTGAMPLFDGGVTVSGSGAALISGTEYEISGLSLDTPQCTWAISQLLGANYLGDYVLRLEQGTAGALTWTPGVGQPGDVNYSPPIGQWAAVGLTKLRVNVGQSPVTMTFKVGDETGTQTNGFDPNKPYIKAIGLQFSYWPYDGVSFATGQTGSATVNVTSKYNANDGYGGSPLLGSVVGGISAYNGSARVSSGPAGDGISWHGAATGTITGLQVLFNDKAGVDHQDGVTAQMSICYVRGNNRNIYVATVAAAGTLTWTNIIVVRENNDGLNTVEFDVGANNIARFMTVVNLGAQTAGTNGIVINGTGTALIQDCITDGHGVGLRNTATGGLTHDHNDHHDTSAYAGTTAGTGDITSDPLFTSRATADFTLQSPASPCIGAGTAITGVTTDYTGAPRANPPSMGAYES